MGRDGFNEGTFDNGSFDKDVERFIELGEVKLRDGFEIEGSGGKELVRVIKLRESTAGDIQDAAEAAEKLIRTGDGYQLVQSNTRTGMELLRRQVEKYGEINGPMPLAVLRKLSAFDLKLLTAVGEGIDEASFKTIERRGRDQAARG